MKSLVLIAVLAFSGLVQAQSLRELRCESWSERVEVNLDFGFNGGLRNADAEIYVDGGLSDRMFMNLFGSARQYQYRYLGSFGAEFTLDTWPDLKPQWGRTYRGEIRSRNVNSRNLTCRFW